jgi:nucleoside-diphosphate-sugar epimerase
MNILLTGAFGNIGTSTLDELLQRGHWVRCFDLPTKANRARAQEILGSAQVHWGDLRSLDDLRGAMRGVDVVIHLAYVIPTLSATGVSSETDPDWARAINVEGTKNILSVIQEQAIPPRLLFSSSLHVYGRTQHQKPPRTISDPPMPVEHYAKHKVECERLIMAANIEWSIFRLGASLPIRLVLDPGMFEVPLQNRIEFVHNKDVATAIANALETDECWGRLWLIGGGPRCQYYQRELVQSILEEVGVGMLPEKAFTQQPYPTDWLDTRESQHILQFQQRTLKDYLADLRVRLGFRRVLIRMFRPLIRGWILSRARVRTS